MAFYVTSRSKNTPPKPRRADYAPRTVWLLGRPTVGRSMALIEPDGRSVITSRIQRILQGAAADSLYVQTRNSTYELAQARVAEDSSITRRVSR